jgi:UDP-N-acetylglucosamine:LPS N-acetylglucosamine transferase
MPRPSVPCERPPTIVIFSAAIGGGHLALAHALQEDLAEAGRQAVVRDGLRDLGWTTAWITRCGYVFQLKFAPWSIRPNFNFKTNPVVTARLRVFYGHIYGRRLLRAIRQVQPDLVVSTHPLITTILSSLRRTGRLQVPVVTVIADYGAHAMWVGPHTDLHLVSSEPSCRMVQHAGGRAAVGLIPVARDFRQPVERREARARLGLSTDRFIVLIACGAWGVGDVEPAVAGAIAAGAYPVVVTGNNTALRARLDDRYRDPDSACILSWTREMPLLMAAADCLVQNAGGMTCHEAAAMRLPVIFFHPIPGHGELNAEVMTVAGAAVQVGSVDELAATLSDAVTGRLTLLPPPRCGRPVAATLAELASQTPRSLVARRSRAVQPRWGLAMVAVLALFLWMTMTPWTGSVGAMLMPAGVTARDVPAGTVALVVRISDPATARSLEDAVVTDGLPVALFVNRHAAEGLYPSRKVTIGVAQDDNTTFLTHPVREWQANRATTTMMRRLTGTTRFYVLPPRDGRTVLATVFAPDHTRQVGARHGRGRRWRSGIVALDVGGLSPEQALAEVRQAIAELTQEGLQCVSLPSLS